MCAEMGRSPKCVWCRTVCGDMHTYMLALKVPGEGTGDPGSRQWETYFLLYSLLYSVNLFTPCLYYFLPP